MIHEWNSSERDGVIWDSWISLVWFDGRWMRGCVYQVLGTNEWVVLEVKVVWNGVETPNWNEHILGERWLQYSRTDKRLLMAACGEGSLEPFGELQTGLNRGFTVDDSGNGAGERVKWSLLKLCGMVKVDVLNLVLLCLNAFPPPFLSHIRKWLWKPP